MADLTIQILRIAAITFPSSSRLDRTRFTAPSHTTTRPALAIDRKRPASFHGSRTRTKAPAFPPARIDGLRFVREIERFMRNGKTPDRFALIIGNTFLGTNVRSLILTKAPASMFRQPYAITSG